jgi:integrase
MKWLQPQIGSNPVQFVEKVGTNGTDKRKRRAFTVEELQRLEKVSGKRAVVYKIAALTGIRRGELREIEWRDVHLDGPSPFIYVRASIAKNHDDAMQPLTPDGAAALRQLRPVKALPNDHVFAGLIPRIERFRRDLEEAGIPYVDARGEYADFHALRTTFGTMLTLAGVGQRTIMELMRHSDMRLTAKVYTDSNMLPVSDAVALLCAFAEKRTDPQIDPQKLVPQSPLVSVVVPLTTNNGMLLSVGNEEISPSKSSSVMQSPELADGARCRVRTCDFLRVKQALYH